MRLSRENFARVHLIAWLLLLALFAIRTTPNLIRDLKRDPLLEATPDSSMDRLLRPLLGVKAPTLRLNAALLELPAKSRIVFVSPKGDDRWDFVYSAVCYLSWPHSIDRVELVPNQSFTGDVNSGDAIIFCGTAPNMNRGEQTRIGDSLVLVRTSNK